MMSRITRPNITARATMSLAMAATTPLISPSPSAMTTAPSRLPTPPATTTRKLSTTSAVPMSGETVLKPATSTPVMPARPAPNAKVQAFTRCTSMPQAAAMRGLRMMARTCMPMLVRYSRNQVASVSTRVAATMKAR